jgi:serine phosphatase RsbU (regulator of sigma subunit)
MPIMEVQVAVAKVGKYATSESGDSLEMIERPEGGLSFVLVDGQRSGKAAKNISIVVARKAISLLAEGVRDGAAARAASDYLYTYRSGKVSATLNILSIDLASKTIVITRNNPDPVVLIRADETQLLDTPTDPVGTRRGTRPDITEISIEENLTVIVYTDGLTHAGDRRGTPMDVLGSIEELLRAGTPNPAKWADRLLEHALDLDEGRPTDDISILVAATLPSSGDDSRRLHIRVPI